MSIRRGYLKVAAACAPVALVMLATQMTPVMASAALPVHLEGGRAYQQPGLEHWHPPTDESERTPLLVKAQEDALQHSLGSGRAATFRTSEGPEVQVRLQRTSTGFRYSLGSADPIRVRFDASYTPDQKSEVLSRLIDYHCQVPTHFRPLLREVSVETRGLLGNVTARREGSRCRFIGAENLNESNFTHEFGHLAGSAIESCQDTWAQWLLGNYEQRWIPGRSNSAPDEWSTAMRRDRRPISTYAHETPGLEEDFAEFWTAYHEARESGTEATSRLRELYPSRTGVMERALTPRR